MGRLRLHHFIFENLNLVSNGCDLCPKRFHGRLNHERDKPAPLPRPNTCSKFWVGGVRVERLVVLSQTTLEALFHKEA